MDVFKNSEKGMALPAVIMVMLITFTLSAAVLTMGTSQVNTEISIRKQYSSITGCRSRA